MRIAPKSWGEFQHYSRRTPPWIKLHKKLLDNLDFHRLPLASRALAPMLWLLASECENGVIDARLDHLVFRLRLDPTEIKAGLKPLIDNGFFEEIVTADEMLARRQQSATPETERETEKSYVDSASPNPPDAAEVQKSPEVETAKAIDVAKAKAKPPKPPKPEIPPCPHQEIADLYNRTLPELPSVVKIGPQREKAIKGVWGWLFTAKHPTLLEPRAKTASEALGWFLRFFETARHNDFLMGRTGNSASHANWRCSIDFLMSEKGQTQVLEKTEVPA